MAEEFDKTPRPIRPGITSERSLFDQTAPVVERYARTLTHIVQSIIENSGTGDGDKVVEGIEQAIRESGLSPYQRAKAQEGFTVFTNAFLEEGPHIIQKPHLRVLRREREQ